MTAKNLLNPGLNIGTTECFSWEEFCNTVRNESGKLFPLYRGQSSTNWGLVPPSARGRAVLEQYSGAIGLVTGPAPSGQLKYFEHLAKGLPGTDISNCDNIDIEALGRHHGLATQLLDWTSRPYIAAFFAFADALDRANDGRVSAGTFSQVQMMSPVEPICIWRFSGYESLVSDGEFEFIDSLSAINHWQKAQAGSFTRLVHEEYYELANYLDSKGAIDKLHRYTIPGGETYKALRDLENMNITFATLSPDFRGAAQQANLGYYLQILGMTP